MSSTFGFQAELESKYPQGEGSWLLRACVTEVFPHMPICAVLSDRNKQRSVAILHGGVPVGLPGQRGSVVINTDIEGIIRQVPTCVVKGNTYGEHCFYGMMWADPQVGAVTGKPGRGTPFSESATLDFCNANKVSQLVRSHQPPDDLGVNGEGFCSVHNNRCLTVFSASNYCGSIGNKGAVLICSDDTFGSKGLRPADHWAPAWPELSKILSMHYSNQISDYQRAVTDAESRARASILGVGMPAPTSSFVAAPGEKPGSEVVPAQVQSASSKTSRNNAALQQVESMVVERICKKKQLLLAAFEAADTRMMLEVSKSRWNSIMSQQLSEVPAVWPALADSWGLKEPVRYVEFLHRFQIIAEMSKSSPGTDSFSAMSRVRLKLSDVSAKDLLGDFGGQTINDVSREELERFLNKWGAHITESQAAALHSGIKAYLRRKPTVEDVLLAVALVSEHETNTGAGASDLAKWLGTALTSEGRPLAGFFIYNDTDKDGFLSTQEFMQAVMSWQQGRMQQLGTPQLQQLATHIDAQGQQNGRIGLIEFLRALGPRAYAMELASLMLTEVLMPVYFYKPTLMEHLSEHSLKLRTSVSWDAFYEALEVMNARMSALGEKPMSRVQMEQICDIAAKGGNRIHYKEFLNSLKAVDTYQRQQMAGMGANVMGAALAPPPEPDAPYRANSRISDGFGGDDLINKAKSQLDAWKHRRPSHNPSGDPHPAGGPGQAPPPPWQDERIQDMRDDFREGFRDMKNRFRR